MTICNKVKYDAFCNEISAIQGADVWEPVMDDTDQSPNIELVSPTIERITQIKELLTKYHYDIITEVNSIEYNVYIIWFEER